MHKKNLRKAAVLVATLDRDTAAKILRQLRPSQAAQVRLAADQLTDISPAERRQVLNEFLQSGGTQAATAPITRPADTGVELDPSLARKLSPAVAAEDPARFVEPPNSSAPGEDLNLHDADGTALAPLLAGEHPQTIALVLSRLSANTAADVLTRLHPPLQATVARRLLDLDEADPEILHEVEHELSETLRTRLQTAQRRQVGAETLCKILQAATEHDRDQLLRNLRQHELPRDDNPSQQSQPTAASSAVHGEPPLRVKAQDPDPSRMLPQRDTTTQPATLAHDENRGRSMKAPTESRPNHEPNWDFSRVADLADDALRRVMKRIDPDVARLALIGANQGLVDRVLTLFPDPLAKQLQRELTELAPTHLRDVELAQKEVAAVAAHVVETAREEAANNI